jgi:DNA-binding NtrC family response regulator
MMEKEKNWEVSLLLVEDEEDVRLNILEFLQMHFDSVHAAASGEEGLETFLRDKPDIVLTDIRMPGMGGLEMASRIKESSPDTPVIILSALYEKDLLEKAIDIGIDKYVRKPPDYEKLLKAIRKSALPIIQAKEIRRLNKKYLTSIEMQLSRSPAMREVIEGIRKVAKSDFSVIIQGETGVGKSFVARMVHDLSRRTDKPFITVDIGTIPETLVESELFGHTKGAFTGADKSKKGFFEIAHGGTLFLEELENMTPYVQGKLLRAVEEKRIFPVGSTTPVDVDIRIIGATNKNILEEVQNQNFREDLYYRLCEFDLNIVPLRERPEDIRWLAEKFVNEVAAELDARISEITPPALKILKKYPWKGNVREMKNTMRRIVLMCDSNRITDKDVLRILLPKPPVNPEDTGTFFLPDDYALADMVSEAERAAIMRALNKTGGKKVKAASLLNIDFKTLTTKMEKYNLS